MSAESQSRTLADDTESDELTHEQAKRRIRNLLAGSARRKRGRHGGDDDQ